MESRGISRRHVLQGIAASAIVVAEGGLAGRARAEDKFTVASTGGSWGDGIKASFVTATDFEKKAKVTVSYAQQLESVAASKIIASCGTRPFTAPTHGQPEAALLADAGCAAPYTLAMIPNSKDIPPTLALEQRPGVGPYWAPMYF